MRGAQQQAQNLEGTAGTDAANYGTGASSISSVLTPFLTREMTNPGGISQQDQTAELSGALAGAGGVASGLATKADERSAATGNASGVGASMDDIAREREKAAAGASSGIATQNTQTKLNQQQEGAAGLRGLYGTDVSAQLGAMGVQNNAVGQEVNAGSHGWFQNMTNMISDTSKLIAAIKSGSSASGAAPPGGGPDNSGSSGPAEDEMGNAVGDGQD